MFEQYLNYLQSARRLSSHTLDAYRRDIAVFEQFLRDEGVSTAEASTGTARAFVAELSRRRMSAAGVNRALSALRGYYEFLVQHGAASGNPFASVHSLKKSGRLPGVLYEEEMDKMLSGPATAGGDAFAVARNRLILELLYSSGCRVSELVGIDVTHVNLKERTVLVRGKGRKERYVFVGVEAARALTDYLPHRNGRVDRNDPDAARALVLNFRGARITRRGIADIIRRVSVAAGVDKRVTPHTFRHSFATHVLDRGADIRVVQEMLGHANLSTTQVYTHVGLERLRSVYEKAHPHAGKKGKKRNERV